MFLVKWKGYDEHSDSETWESLAHLENSPSHLKTFYSLRPRAIGRKESFAFISKHSEN